MAVLSARLKQLTLNAAAVLTLALAPAASAAAPPLVDIGTLGGSWSYPNLINNTGMVVGGAALPGDANSTTFAWSEATGIVALPPIGVGGIQAGFLTDAGLVGGQYTTGSLDANGYPATQAFLWSAAAGYRFPGTLGGSYSSVQFVNSAGTVVGDSTLAGDAITRTFVWTAAGGMTDIGSFSGGWTHAEAINASGQIIGESATADGNWQPFIWDAAHGMQPIVTGLDAAQPFLLSDSGVVWGNGYPSSGGTHQIYSWSAASGARTFDMSSFLTGPFAWAAQFQFRGLTPSGKAIVGAFVLMGGDYGFVIDPVAGPQVIVPPGGSADGSGVGLNGVSKAGHAVGYYYRTGTGSLHAFIWDEVNGARDLGVLPGGSYSTAYGVNSRGEVTGEADTATGETHAFLWTAAAGMQDLGTLGGSSSGCNLIGDSGLAGQSSLAGDLSSHAFFVKLSAGQPDLSVKSIAIAYDKKKGKDDDKEHGRGDDKENAKTATITIIIANTGTASARASVTGVWDGSKLIGNVATPAIDAGKTVTVTVSWNLKKVEEGKHTISVTANATHVVVESNMNNNTGTVTFKVKED